MHVKWSNPSRLVRRTLPSAILPLWNAAENPMHSWVQLNYTCFTPPPPTVLSWKTPPIKFGPQWTRLDPSPKLGYVAIVWLWEIRFHFSHGQENMRFQAWCSKSGTSSAVSEKDWNKQIINQFLFYFGKILEWLTILMMPQFRTSALYQPYICRISAVCLNVGITTLGPLTQIKWSNCSVQPFIPSFSPLYTYILIVKDGYCPCLNVKFLPYLCVHL